ncbi:MAG: tRNA lysidine(34) synthetase TilS [Planctomycetota bacterium]|jgi:tRNA(Ile)-lysidine synthase
MLFEFEKKVSDFIKAGTRLVSGGKVLLAVSGGADSTALLYVMCGLKGDGVLKREFLCAHINHQLRGVESDKDEDFVIAEASKLNVPVTTRRIDIRKFALENKLSIETAGRQLRIDGLLDIARANECKFIATAHHKDDNAETVIQRIARGTGIRGLGGIWPERNFGGGISFVRPLLCVRREEIIEYLKQRDIEWRQDRTNEDCRYRRNFIRHRLIPSLQGDSNISVAEQLYELSAAARKFYDVVRSSADKLWPQLADCSEEKIVLDLKKFVPQAPAVKVELMRRSLTNLGSGERDLRQEHLERILELAEHKTGGKKIVLPERFIAYCEYGKLIFCRSKISRRSDKEMDRSIKVKVPGQTRFGDYLIEGAVFKTELGGGDFKAGKTSFVEWFDLDKLKPPLEVRFRREGERFRPLGLSEEKKVGKFLTASKVPLRIRRRVLIVGDSEKIIWVWPIRMSEQAKVDKATSRILRLQITDASIEARRHY